MPPMQHIPVMAIPEVHRVFIFGFRYSPIELSDFDDMLPLFCLARLKAPRIFVAPAIAIIDGILRSMTHFRVTTPAPTTSGWAG